MWAKYYWWFDDLASRLTILSVGTETPWVTTKSQTKSLLVSSSISEEPSIIIFASVLSEPSLQLEAFQNDNGIPDERKKSDFFWIWIYGYDQVKKRTKQK